MKFIIIAWTTAAVDNKRVSAAIPIVLDVLNIQKVSDMIPINT